MLFGFSHCVAAIDLLVSLFGLRVHSYGFLNQTVIKPAEGRKTNRWCTCISDLSDSGTSIVLVNSLFLQQ